MTNEKIIGLAKQAGFLIDEAPIAQPYVIQATHYKIDDELQRFYELVRNEVLEEAAKVCESLDEASGPCSWHYEIATQDCANAIRSMK